MAMNVQSGVVWAQMKSLCRARGQRGTRGACVGNGKLLFGVLR